ncbi:hypothetical protein [Pseudomonas lijiangensis]|uniref:Uncharacterized protein n=1 Tax=Pseudomonas lijiangensis TaxID=2995658 RepID=A0ABX8HYK2_9PSED|nr:hypothetical protein [Pseudomonas lijiangensis]MBX8499182.1 hypothetical protein [Pseudomonas lijiangensis]MBX8504761.1 hypothetical protein [Pseudomonas lijiangensis]QWU85092.1 hypothetical protein KQP88_10150 [Pseudomonas lijiangensis]
MSDMMPTFGARLLQQHVVDGSLWTPFKKTCRSESGWKFLSLLIWSSEIFFMYACISKFMIKGIHSPAAANSASKKTKSLTRINSI